MYYYLTVKNRCQKKIHFLERWQPILKLVPVPQLKQHQSLFPATLQFRLAFATWKWVNQKCNAVLQNPSHQLRPLFAKRQDGLRPPPTFFINFISFLKKNTQTLSRPRLRWCSSGRLTKRTEATDYRWNITAEIAHIFLKRCRKEIGR